MAGGPEAAVVDADHYEEVVVGVLQELHLDLVRLRLDRELVVRS